MMDAHRSARRDDIVRRRRGRSPVAPAARAQEIRTRVTDALQDARFQVDDAIRAQGRRIERQERALVPTGRQYVIVLQDDKLLKNFAALLHARNPERSTIWYWYGAPADRVPQMAGECDEAIVLDQTSDIFLVGHGDMSFRTLAGLSGSALALRFKARFAGFAVRRISIIGCLTGSRVGTGGTLEVPKNFTQQFHQHLLPIRTAVTGRNRCILITRTAGQGGRVVEVDCDARDVGHLYDSTNQTEGRDQDKLTYYWEEGQQKHRFGD